MGNVLGWLESLREGKILGTKTTDVILFMNKGNNNSTAARLKMHCFNL